jgi:hypothetical protein
MNSSRSRSIPLCCETTPATGAVTLCNKEGRGYVAPAFSAKFVIRKEVFLPRQLLAGPNFTTGYLRA